MKYLHIYLLFLLIFFGCKNSGDEYYKELLEKEFFSIFFKNNKAFISDDEFKKISHIKDKYKFLESLLNLLKNGTVKSIYNFGLYDNIDYEINIDSIFINRDIEIKEKIIIEYYLKLNNELNKQLYFPAIKSLSSGKYKIFYNIIKKYISNYNDYDKNLLNEFITNLPDPKMCILCDYMFLKAYGEEKKLNGKKIYEVYNQINSDNYELLLKKDFIYNQAYNNKAIYKEILEAEISSIKGYYKLKDLLKE